MNSSFKTYVLNKNIALIIINKGFYGNEDKITK